MSCTFLCVYLSGLLAEMILFINQSPEIIYLEFEFVVYKIQLY